MASISSIHCVRQSGSVQELLGADTVNSFPLFLGVHFVRVLLSVEIASSSFLQPSVESALTLDFSLFLEHLTFSQV